MLDTYCHEHQFVLAKKLFPLSFYIIMYIGVTKQSHNVSDLMLNSCPRGLHCLCGWT